MIYGKEDFEEFASYDDEEEEEFDSGWEDTTPDKEEDEERETKALGEEEYQGIPFDKQEVIRRHVNREEKAWFDEPAPELPKFEKPVVKRDAVGWLNFTKDVFISKVKQL